VPKHVQLDPVVAADAFAWPFVEPVYMAGTNGPEDAQLVVVDELLSYLPEQPEKGAVESVDPLRQFAVGDAEPFGATLWFGR
jgi:hypothetical protein